MNDTIGEKIRLARLAKGYSQQAMAYMLNMEQPTFCKLETGSRELRVSELERIAIILEKPVSDFFPHSNLSG